MSADLHTNTEADAGLADRATAHVVDERDHDVPGVPANHDCAETPDPDCHGCLVWATFYDRLRTEIAAERNAEYWESA